MAGQKINFNILQVSVMEFIISDLVILLLKKLGQYYKRGKAG